MNIKAIRSDRIYRKMIYSTNEERENLYRYELMKPFEFKWKCIGMPLKAEQDGGYDVVSASSMGGGAPKRFYPASDSCISAMRDLLKTLTKTVKAPLSLWRILLPFTAPNKYMVHIVQSKQVSIGLVALCFCLTFPL
jgi:uncharacterized protein YjaZ